MQQLVFEGPGKAAWRDVERPTLDKPTEALVRPVAVTLCDLDRAVLTGQVPAEPGMRLGHEFVAEIVELGDEVQVPEAKRYLVPFQISCGTCQRCLRGLTGSCASVPPLAMYGLSAFGGGDWGGALTDLVRVPFPGMLVPLPDNTPDVVAAVGDNFSDAYRCVAGPLMRTPGASVLVVGGGGAPSIGLYACHIAKALGASEVSYADDDHERLRVAEGLGCQVIEGYPKRVGPMAVTVEASSRPAGLLLAVRSTEPGGECTTPAIYFKPVELPMLEMYSRGLTLHVGRAHVRAVLPEILGYIAGGVLNPASIGVQQSTWDGAAEAIVQPPTKLLISRG